MDIVEWLHSYIADYSQTETTDEKLHKVIEEIESLRKQLAESQAREAKYREALLEFDGLIRHQYSGSREAMSDLTYAAQHAKKVLDMPSDDTALRQANEAYLNASPEVQLLNTIGGFLENVEYTGSYLHGIFAYGKQAKKEALLEAANKLRDADWREWNTGVFIEDELRRMAEEIA